MKPRCDHCRFWINMGDHGPPDGRQGECRRYPVQDSVERWQHTFGEDWCGEFKPASKKSR